MVELNVTIVLHRKAIYDKECCSRMVLHLKICVIHKVFGTKNINKFGIEIKVAVNY